jgi:hypothetical protein
MKLTGIDGDEIIMANFKESCQHSPIFTMTNYKNS